MLPYELRHWGQTCPQCKSGVVLATTDGGYGCIQCRWSPFSERENKPSPSPRRPKPHKKPKRER